MNRTGRSLPRRHPLESALALYAGGDLRFVERVRVNLHLRRCDACRAHLESFAAARERLAAERDALPEDLNWDRLAAEMTGNVRVGLAAGECVAGLSLRQHTRAVWKPVLAAAATTVLVVSGLWLNFPAEQRQSLARGLQRIWTRDGRVPADNSIYLEATHAGIQVKENGGALTMMSPASTPSVISVSMQGSVRARFVDADTGQVTITNVYSQ